MSRIHLGTQQTGSITPERLKSAPSNMTKPAVPEPTKKTESKKENKRVSLFDTVSLFE